MSAPIRFSVNLSAMHYRPDQYRKVIRAAQVAEEVGLDEVTMSEHLVMSGATDNYGGGRGYAGQLDEPWMEPLSVLAVMAGATERIRLGTGIMIASLRPAPLLAKAAATVDQLCQGRLALGVGASWHMGEYRALGVSFENRGRVLTDTIAACRSLWTDSPSTFHSETVNFDEVYCEPRPFRPGGPLVFFAGKFSPRNVRRIVELGHGWLPNDPDLGRVRDGIQELRERFVEAGRDPDELEVVGPVFGRGSDGAPYMGLDGGADIAKSLDVQVQDFVDNGQNTLGVGSRFYANGPEEVETFIRAYGKWVEGYRS